MKSHYLQTKLSGREMCLKLTTGHLSIEIYQVVTPLKTMCDKDTGWEFSVLLWKPSACPLYVSRYLVRSRTSVVRIWILERLPWRFRVSCIFSLFSHMRVILVGTESKRKRQATVSNRPATFANISIQGKRKSVRNRYHLTEVNAFQVIAVSDISPGVEVAACTEE